MSALEERFKNAVEEVSHLPSKPNNEHLLKLYALYKQATKGDVDGSRPGFMDITGRAKYDAWSKLDGKTQEAAQEEYIALVEDLKEPVA